MTTLRTARPHEPRVADEHRVLIVRKKMPWTPTTSYDEWTRALSPSPALRAEVKRRGLSEETWAFFVPRFLEEMQDDEARIMLAYYRRMLDTGTAVTLLCYCRDESRCHRAIVKSLLEGQA